MIQLNNTWVNGDSRSLRNFFNDFCDGLEKAESMWEQVAEMENRLDELVGIEAHRDELVELNIQLENELTEKDKQIEDLKRQLKDLKKVNKDLVALTKLNNTTSEAETSEHVPKLKIKKKIIKKK